MRRLPTRAHPGLRLLARRITPALARFLHPRGTAALTCAWVVLTLGCGAPRGTIPVAAAAAGGDATAPVARADFVRTIRVTGRLEARQSYTLLVPRMAGQTANPLVITSLAPAGRQVSPGDVVVRLDPQEQQRVALDKRAEWIGLQAELEKTEAGHKAEDAQDRTALQLAESAVAGAKLEMLKNELLPQIEVERNQRALEAAETRVRALREMAALKRRMRQAARRSVEVRRDRAHVAMVQAERNMARMVLRTPIAGVVVIKTTWRGGSFTDIQEGEQVRPGVPLADIVGPGDMYVRADVNQADRHHLRIGQRAAVRLEAFPARTFPASVERMTPVAGMSSPTARVRIFEAILRVEVVDPTLLPDLTVAADLEVERIAGALVVPRRAVIERDGRHYVHVERGGATGEREVVVAARNELVAAIAKGLEEGEVVVLDPGQRTGSGS